MSDYPTTPRFTPADPNYRDRVEASFASQHAMSSLRVIIDKLAPGEIELILPYQSAFTQQHGFIHAGIISTVLDSACGYAAFSLMPADTEVLTAEYKINLLAPAQGSSFRMVGRVVKPGRTLSVCQADAIAYNGGKSKLIATMTGTLMAIVNRDDVRQQSNRSD